MKKKVLLGASIGNCVHVAGVVHFLQLAEKEGYETVFLGPAVSVELLFDAIERFKPDVVGISYRLTPQNAEPLLEEVYSRAEKLSHKPVWVFGGTFPTAEVAKRGGFFAFVSDGYDTISDSICFLRGGTREDAAVEYASNIIDRVDAISPYPVLRHHYGVPSLEETISGIKTIAEAKALDVISLGPDQNAQQFFFRPERMDRKFDGAGGVPIRTEDDLLRMKEASRRGNFPLMRCYSGTDDVFDYADLLVRTIDNAWAAIPLFWYNELDGRGTRTIENSIREAQELIRWHALRDIPVELNEPHHWGLRDAHDVIQVAAAYICACNAKKQGVKNYIAQYMFNIPTGNSFSMDFARVLAMMELTESLQDDSFRTLRQTRAGLPLLHADEAVAKGDLAASTFMQMSLKPHIVHVVGYCEADHAASAEDVIESCKIVRGVIRNVLEDNFSIERDERIVERKEELIREARYLLDFIRNKYSASDDPLCDAEVLADIVKKGYFDAVHIVKGGKFTGDLKTRIIDGACRAFDADINNALDETARLARLETKYE